MLTVGEGEVVVSGQWQGVVLGHSDGHVVVGFQVVELVVGLQVVVEVVDAVGGGLQVVVLVGGVGGVGGRVEVGLHVLVEIVVEVGVELGHGGGVSSEIT